MNMILTAVKWLLVAVSAFILLGMAVLLSGILFPARAQGMICAGKAEMLAFLLKKYDETPAGGGVLTNGWPTLITAQPSGKTFTYLFIRPDGMACIMATGRGFAIAPQERHLPRRKGNLSMSLGERGIS